MAFRLRAQPLWAQNELRVPAAKGLTSGRRSLWLIVFLLAAAGVRNVWRLKMEQSWSQLQKRLYRGCRVLAGACGVALFLLPTVKVKALPGLMVPFSRVKGIMRFRTVLWGFSFQISDQPFCFLH